MGDGIGPHNLGRIISVRDQEYRVEVQSKVGFKPIHE